MHTERTSRQVFLGVLALLFAASAATTIGWSMSMSGMGAMPMPGGWTMSMTWLRMPGQTWPAAAASFLVMWVVMMSAMMLPSLMPVLWRYRETIGGAGEMRSGGLTAMLCLGYFLVWAILGMAVYPLGVAMAAVEMAFPSLALAVPSTAGAVMLIGGALQFTPWKKHHLACCRETPGYDQMHQADLGTAWRLGLGLGLHCVQCCADQTAILLVAGVMDIRAMVVVALAISLERLAPAGERLARATGAIAIAAGLFWIVRSAWL
jgi:predicted metal-binding membrane protein